MEWISSYTQWLCSHLVDKDALTCGDNVMYVGTLVFAIFVITVLVIWKMVDYLLRLPFVSDVSSKHVLITGCDTGFGHEAALEMDSLGCTVFAACLTEEGVKTIKSKASGKLHAIQMDVSNTESVKTALYEVKRYLPQGTGLWALLNNAGVLGTPGPTEWLNTDEYRKVLNVNVLGMVEVTHQCLPLLEKPGGRIVNTCSILGYISLPYCAAYSMSKHAVKAFSDATRRELGHDGISVHNIEPGAHRTPFLSPERINSNLQTAHASRMKDAPSKRLIEKVSWISTKFMYTLATPGSEGVVRAYTHAALARFPCRSYMVGADAWGMWLLTVLWPAWMVDSAIELLLKLSDWVA